MLMDWKAVLIHGSVLSLFESIILLLIGLKNPRIMLQDYPKSIQEIVPPKSPKEKKLTFIYGIPFLLMMIVYPLIVTIIANKNSSMTFIQLVGLSWAILSFFNLYDLIIVDWLVVCTLRPKFAVIPGTENNAGYRDYLFHFFAFLKGIVITLLLSVMISFLAKFVFQGN